MDYNPCPIYVLFVKVIMTIIKLHVYDMVPSSQTRWCLNGRAATIMRLIVVGVGETFVL